MIVATLLVSTLLSSFTAIVSTRAADRANTTANELRTEIAKRVATGCIDDWDRVMGARNGIATSIDGVIHVLITAFPNANPNLIGNVEQLAARTIEDAQGDIPDPDCDLESAERRLRELEGG